MKAALFTASALLASASLHAQTGNVGIGTTAPQAKLHAIGGIRFDTLAGAGNRVVYADEVGKLFTRPVPYATAATPIPIADDGCNATVPTGAVSTIHVTGQPGSVFSSDIRVSVNITHTYIGDVVLFLQAPTGQVLKLTPGGGNATVNMENTVFSDAGAYPVASTVTRLIGAFIPDGSTYPQCGVNPNVSSFGGFGSAGSIQPNGVWTLRAFDRWNPDAGVLQSWSISFDNRDPIAGQVVSAGFVPRGTSSGGLTNGTIYDAGNAIGINTTTPHAPLQIGGGSGKKIVLYESQVNTNEFTGFGSYGGSLRYQVPNSYEDHVFMRGSSATASTELFRISGAGNVGIGVSQPRAPLQLNNSQSNRKVVLYESYNNDHEFFGFGINANTLRYQIASSSDNHIFFAGATQSSSAELMRLTGTGNIGFGTATPGVRAKMEIHGAAWATVNAYRYMNSTSDGNTTNGSPTPYSLYTSDRIWCNGEINVTSDLRTKERISSALPSADLALVNRLRVVDFNYVDRATKGDTRVKGFLAQEVEAVMPDAVMKNTGVVPDIYRKAESVQHDAAASTLSVSMKAAHGLKGGDTVKIITDGGDKLVPVVAVKDSLHFTVGEWKEATDWAFVYGTQVHDLRNLDYNKIFSAGISAIQELSRQASNLEKRMTAAEANASDAKREVAELRATVERLVRASPTASR